MKPSDNVSISATSRAVIELEEGASEFDRGVRENVAELLRVRQELSTLITQRGALTATFKLIFDYRQDGDQTYDNRGKYIPLLI